MKSNYSSNSKVYILIILFIHILAHYFTFERLSYGSDSFADYLRYLSSTDFRIIDYIKISPDRPLNFIFLDFQNYFLFDNNKLSFILLIFSTFLILIFVYIIIFQLTKSKEFAFITVIIYDLIPIKSEIFHNVVFLNINIVTSIYLLSIILFLLYINSKRQIFAYIACILYSTAIYWYEIGFFIPIVFVLYLIITKIKIKNHLFFLVLVSFISFTYIIFRYSDLIAISSNQESHSINFTDNRSFIDMFHFIFGRYHLKYIYYGFYQFIFSSSFLKFTLIILNLIITYVFYQKIKNFSFKSQTIKNSFLFLTLMFFISLIPIILNGSAGGRHFILPSIAISFYLIILINYFFKKYIKIVFSLIIFISLIISQGNCIIQTKSMEIERDLINYIKENKSEILNSDLIIFDAKSYMNNIQYTLVQNPNNFFNTYFGFQMFEEWGVRSLINIYSDNYKFKKNIVIVYSVGEININNNNIEYQTIQTKEYAKYSIVKKIHNSKNYFIITFDKVYLDNERYFNNI